MKDSNIYIQGSVEFQTYITQIEQKYGIYFDISGQYPDTYYKLDVICQNETHEIPKYILPYSYYLQQRTITFEDFITNYKDEFEQQITHTSINPIQYSII
jgi:hypothetical protein